MRAGVRLANARGVTAVHDKDGWLGALRLWQRLDGTRPLTLRVWQSIPHDRARRGGDRRPALRVRQPAPEARLPEGVHGRHARLADRVDARRHAACRSRAARSSPRSSRRGADAGFPGRRARDRRPREPRGARRVRADARRLGAARATPADRARAAARARGRRPLRGARRRRARCSSRTRRPTATSPIAYWAGQDRRRLRLPLARSTPAPSSRTAPTRRSRSSTRSQASAPASAARSTTARPWHPEQALTVEQAFQATCVDAGLARARRAPARHAAPRPLRRPRRARPRPVAMTSTRRSSRRWSAAAGCTTRRPGTRKAQASQDLA